MIKSERLTTLLLVLLTIGMTVFCYQRFAGGQSPDLMATWLAGRFFALGAMDQIYPADDTIYTMLPPSDWWDYLVSEDRAGPVFPYVYPPLWAALISPLTTVVDMRQFQAGASVINPVLMSLTVILACRAAGLRGGILVLGTAVGLGIFLLTLSGGVALEQNQPQILVSFLIVAAIERDRAGASKTAGLALALAAAIKLYPAALALLWLAAGRRRSAISFALCGAALGLASIALAGWPLHLTFLHEVGIIKDTVMKTYFTYGIDQIVANVVFADQGTFIAAIDNPPGAAEVGGWTILLKGPVWSTLSSIGMLSVLGGGIWWVRRHAAGSALAWPAVLIGINMLSPLAWGYHYLPSLAFAPALLAIYGTRWGALMLVAFIGPISIPALGYLTIGPNPELLPQIAGTLAMLGLGIALLLAPAPKPA